MTRGDPTVGEGVLQAMHASSHAEIQSHALWCLQGLEALLFRDDELVQDVKRLDSDMQVRRVPRHQCPFQDCSLSLEILKQWPVWS